MNRTVAAFLTIVFIFAFSIDSADAQGVTQFQRRATIGGKIPVYILMLGWSKDSRAIEKVFDILIARANDSYLRLDWQNTSSEVAKVNAAAGAGAVGVSPEVASAFKVATKIAEWTGGAFDVTYAGSGSWRDVKVSGDSVELQKQGMNVRFDGMMEGYLADLIVFYIKSSGMTNAMVKVGDVFRGIGSSLHGPWKVQIEEATGIFAHHAISLTVENTAVAAASVDSLRGLNLIDPRSKGQKSPSCKGAVVVMKEAADAQGLAHAVFVLGPDEGMKLMTKMSKGMIIDNNGKFLRTPGF